MQSRFAARGQPMDMPRCRRLL
uniref:Uncharacterized protein n=1 Tax=Rhizophora mucronata TaxID=61149 RepID=A0A2P2PR64_RHIMU